MSKRIKRVAWNSGLNKYVDFRLQKIGEKISVAKKGKPCKSSTKFKKGHKDNLGKNIGVTNKQWKGEQVSKRVAHKWVAHWKGKPTTCEKCGKTNLTGKQIHWANVDHKYRRVLDDYIRLCVKCHVEFDMINNNKRFKRYEKV